MQVRTHGELSPANLRLIHDLEASGFRSQGIAHHTGFPLSQVNAVLDKGLSCEDLPSGRSGSSHSVESEISVGCAGRRCPASSRMLARGTDPSSGEHRHRLR